MKPGQQLMRHYLQFKDFRAEEYAYLFERTAVIKQRFKNYEKYTPLVDRTLAMIFEKASTRTRVSFEAGMYQMGGSVVHLTTGDSQLGRAEPVEDSARVISRMVDVVMIRTFEQDIIERFARHSRVPVINGLTDLAHPCQALADLLTLRELHGRLRGLKLAFVGDANNVAASLAVACAKTGVQFSVAAPRDYQFDEAFLARLRELNPAAVPYQTTDPREIVKGADAVYTDVWTSMGQESERSERLRAFADYQVNKQLMQLAPAAHFLHCLPAHRGEEVTDEVLDGPQSVVVHQAANRMHAQKGLLAWMLCSPPSACTKS